MKRIVDKGLLLAGGLLMAGTVGKACSAGHSAAVGDDCGGIWQLCGQQTMALCVPCGDVCGLLYPAGTLFFCAGSSV